MKTLPSQELKRRGLAAVESLIEAGPVEIIKRNRPACVIVSVALFRELTGKRPAGRRRAVSELFAQPARGHSQRKEVDAAIREERANWGGR
jgi:PHD/YefM family antitoxin component YafN of YafNO toxin-antitoxin module